jgi:hypothetical protein
MPKWGLSYWRAFTVQRERCSPKEARKSRAEHCHKNLILKLREPNHELATNLETRILKLPSLVLWLTRTRYLLSIAVVDTLRPSVEPALRPFMRVSFTIERTRVASTCTQTHTHTPEHILQHERCMHPNTITSVRSQSRPIFYFFLVGFFLVSSAFFTSPRS